MRIAFRADASAAMGTGHVARCATLAAELASRGAGRVADALWSDRPS